MTPSAPIESRSVPSTRGCAIDVGSLITSGPVLSHRVSSRWLTRAASGEWHAAVLEDGGGLDLATEFQSALDATIDDASAEPPSSALSGLALMRAGSAGAMIVVKGVTWAFAFLGMTESLRSHVGAAGSRVRSNVR
jgi:hypothetical protein